MKALAGMVGAGAVSWLLVWALVDRPTSVAVLFGLLGPLVVSAVSWVMSERTFRRNPEGLNAQMTMAFGGKMVFFGAYVAVVLRGLSQPTVPFVASFTAYFIALHLCEALLLRRLFTS
jgi:uncharacterized Tic20 family protein